MKKVFNSKENSTLELVKRCIYAFQVLIVGVALPVLFIIGISNDASKKPMLPESVHEVSTSDQVSARQVVEDNVPGIIISLNGYSLLNY